jgi:hypothetical protein
MRLVLLRTSRRLGAQGRLAARQQHPPPSNIPHTHIPVSLACSAMMASTVLCIGQGMPAVQLMVAITCGASSSSS